MWPPIIAILKFAVRSITMEAPLTYGRLCVDLLPRCAIWPLSPAYIYFIPQTRAALGFVV